MVSTVRQYTAAALARSDLVDAVAEAHALDEREALA